MKNIISFSGIWTKYDFFQKNLFIPVSLETFYLHLKTSSSLDSGHKLEVQFFDEDQEFVSGITIFFVSKTGKFQLEKCMKKSRPFDTTITAGDNRLWSIEKRGYRMIVSCNGLRVLDVTASSETCNDKKWNSVIWGRKIVWMKLDRSKNNSEETFYHTGKMLNGSSVIELSQFQNVHLF